MSTHAYKHSEAFSRLKRIQETIPQNLTTVEYLTTLDMLQEQALYPIICSTRFVDNVLPKILAFQSKNPKRKTTSEGKQFLPSYIVLYLITASPEQKLKVYKKIGFDRGITREIIQRWLSVMQVYAALINKPEMTVDDVKQSKLSLLRVDALEDDYPLAAYMQVKFWYEKSKLFKEIILEKYVRMCLKAAQMDYVGLQHKVNLEDIMQIYLMAASKAVDRCDANKGVLTTHIENWLKSAKNTVIKLYLEGQNQEVNLPEDDDVVDRMMAKETKIMSDLAETIEDKMERKGTIDRVRQIARFFDRKGYARLMLGIGEYLTPKMSEVLMQHSLQAVPKPEPVK